MATFNKKVFVSHTHADNQRCTPLLAMFDAWGIDYWFDTQQLDAGQQLSERLQQSLAERDLFVRICTEHTAQSFWMDKEVAAFRSLQASDRERGRTRRLIFLILDERYVHEQAQSGDTVIDLTREPREEWIRELRAALGVVAPTRGLSRRTLIGTGAVAALAVAASGAAFVLRGRNASAAPSLPRPATIVPTATSEGSQRVKWFTRLGDSGGSIHIALDPNDTTRLYANGGDALYALDATDGSIVWRNRSAYTGSSIILANGLIYNVGVGLDGTIVTVDAQTGTKVWSAKAGIGFLSTAPALGSGIIAITDHGFVKAFSATDGSPLWKVPVPQSTLSNVPPSISDGVVYTGSALGIVYALDATDGKVLWQYATQGAIQTTPAVANRSVYVGSEDGNLYVFDAKSGSVQKKIGLGGQPSGASLVANGLVYSGTLDQGLIALEASSGKIVWKAATTSKEASTFNEATIGQPLIAGSSILVAAQTIPTSDIFAFTLTDGSLKWRFASTDFSLSGSYALGKGLFYLGGGNTSSAVYALDLTA